MLKVYQQNNLSTVKNIQSLVYFSIFFGCAAVLKGQDINWDLLSYHFYNGFAFLHHRMHQDLMPGLMQTYLNPLFDTLTYLLIKLHHPKVTTFLLGTVNGINAFLIYKISLKVFKMGSDAVSQGSDPILPILLSILIGITGADNISLLGSTTNDTYSTVFVLTAVYFYLLSLDEKPSRFYFCLSALLIGAVFGLKMTNLIYFVGLNIVLLFFELTLTDFLIYWACCFIGFFLVDGAWMYKVYMQFGNPIFPFYNNYFHSIYISKYTFNLSPGFVRVPWYVSLLLPFYLSLNPTTYTSEMDLQDGRLALVFSALILTLIFKFRFANVNKDVKHKNKYLNVLIIFFVASYLVWLWLFSVYRYILPLEMLSGILVIALLKPFFTTKKVFNLSVVLIFILALLSTHAPNWGRKHFGKDYFAVHTPKLPNDAVVVLLTRPYSYTIPYFNPTSHFVGLTFVGLNANADERKDGLLYKLTINTLRKAARENRLYSLGFVKYDLVTTLSYALLLSRKLGPTEECHKFETNLGDHMVLCKLQDFTNHPAIANLGVHSR